MRKRYFVQSWYLTCNDEKIECSGWIFAEENDNHSDEIQALFEYFTEDIEDDELRVSICDELWGNVYEWRNDD